MAERRRISLRVALIAGAGALVLAGLGLFASAPEPERRDAGQAASGLRQVRMLRVERVPVAARVEVSGMLEPRRSIELFAETRGPVTELGAEELDRVEAGQVLVRIDPLLATVAVERAEAALARSESELALARSNLARRRSLFEKGVASDAELDDAVNAERVASAALREARAELLQARDDLDKKTLRAPFDGVLRSFLPEVGEYVQEGQKLAELLDVETARASIGLSDREVVEVGAGQPVEVLVAAYPGERFAGEVLRVAAASDPQTKKFPVEVEVPNPERRLLPGMVARFSLGLGKAEPRTLIPRDAALEEFGLRFVWVVEPDASGWVARRRRVELRPLSFRPGELEVVSGLEQGEHIAVSALGQLSDGERVAGSGVASR